MTATTADRRQRIADLTAEVEAARADHADRCLAVERAEAVTRTIRVNDPDARRLARLRGERDSAAIRLGRLEWTLAKLTSRIG